MPTVTTNWPKALRDFLRSQGEQGNWQATNPDWAHVRWPYRVSPEYLRHQAQVGKNLIWITLVREMMRPDTERVVTGTYTLQVNCYARAFSSNEGDVNDAQERASNMRDEINRLILTNVDQITPAWIIRPGTGGRELLETGITPCFFTQILMLDVWYDG